MKDEAVEVASFVADEELGAANHRTGCRLATQPAELLELELELSKLDESELELSELTSERTVVVGACENGAFWRKTAR